MSSHVRIYLDDEEKWRWRWRHNGETQDSLIGYVAKRDCIEALCAVTLRSYSVTYESRRNATRRAYQQGVLRMSGQPNIPVEVTPWRLDQTKESGV